MAKLSREALEQQLGPLQVTLRNELFARERQLEEVPHTRPDLSPLYCSFSIVVRRQHSITTLT